MSLELKAAIEQRVQALTSLGVSCVYNLEVCLTPEQVVEACVAHKVPTTKSAQSKQQLPMETLRAEVGKKLQGLATPKQLRDGGLARDILDRTLSRRASRLPTDWKEKAYDDKITLLGNIFDVSSGV
jgi:hypothetical protein